MIKNFKENLIMVVLVVSVPLFATILFGCLWSLPSVLGVENIVPPMTAHAFWNIYAIFQFLWGMFVLFLHSLDSEDEV